MPPSSPPLWRTHSYTMMHCYNQVCLELVRQQASIQAAWVDSRHYKKSQAALQDFQGRSVAGRSRYDQETGTQRGMKRLFECDK
jgi:hypothetical protein